MWNCGLHCKGWKYWVGRWLVGWKVLRTRLETRPEEVSHPWIWGEAFWRKMREISLMKFGLVTCQLGSKYCIMVTSNGFGHSMDFEDDVHKCLCSRWRCIWMIEWNKMCTLRKTTAIMTVLPCEGGILSMKSINGSVQMQSGVDNNCSTQVLLLFLPYVAGTHHI